MTDKTEARLFFRERLMQVSSSKRPLLMRYAFEKELATPDGVEWSDEHQNWQPANTSGPAFDAYMVRQLRWEGFKLACQLMTGEL